MPEEINRILTDQISDYLFTTERDAADNLRAEGIPADKILFVGNVMIDTLMKHRAIARERSTVLTRLTLTPREYAVCTLHRPSNVDTPRGRRRTLDAVSQLAKRLKVVLPLHPRSAGKLQEFGLLDAFRAQATVIEPLGYLDFLSLLDNARLVLTDSGGIQEETTVLGVPCLTFRENTERPITVTHGTNRIVGLDPARVGERRRRHHDRPRMRASRPGTLGRPCRRTDHCDPRKPPGAVSVWRPARAARDRHRGRVRPRAWPFSPAPSPGS